MIISTGLFNGVHETHANTCTDCTHHQQNSSDAQVIFLFWIEASLNKLFPLSGPQLTTRHTEGDWMQHAAKGGVETVWEGQTTTTTHRVLHWRNTTPACPSGIQRKCHSAIKCHKPCTGLLTCNLSLNGRCCHMVFKKNAIHTKWNLGFNLLWSFYLFMLFFI